MLVILPNSGEIIEGKRETETTELGQPTLYQNNKSETKFLKLEQKAGNMRK